MSESIDFRNKVILAPMVRVGTLPMRLLALKYGAHLVYTEEIIDYKLMRCKRVVNDALATVDFIDDDQTLVFQTCAREKGKVILQIGTCDAERALKAAKLVEQDVSGIDINMGCPKEFSIKGGMGAALLTKPHKITSILTTLVQNMSLPITCKIRVLPQLEDCIKLAKLIEQTGVKAIGVHGRIKVERPRHANRNHVIEAIANELTIPVIANGGSSDIATHADIEKFRVKTKASSVMIARAAQKNASIFANRDELLPLDDVIKDYLQFAIEFNNHYSNTKYCIQQILGSIHSDDERGKKLLSAQSLKDICLLWHMQDYYDDNFQKMVKKNKNFNSMSDNEGFEVVKRRRLNESSSCYQEVIQMPVIFVKKAFHEDKLPRSVLFEWSKKKECDPPKYVSVQVNKHYYAIATVNGRNYASSYLEKNKRYAEQGAALVASYSLNLIGEDILKECLVKGIPNERMLKEEP